MYVIRFKLNDYLRAINKRKLKIKVIIYEQCFHVCVKAESLSEMEYRRDKVDIWGASLYKGVVLPIYGPHFYDKTGVRYGNPHPWKYDLYIETAP